MLRITRAYNVDEDLISEGISTPKRAAIQRAIAWPGRRRLKAYFSRRYSKLELEVSDHDGNSHVMQCRLSVWTPSLYTPEGVFVALRRAACFYT